MIEFCVGSSSIFNCVCRLWLPPFQSFATRKRRWPSGLLVPQGHSDRLDRYTWSPKLFDSQGFGLGGCLSKHWLFFFRQNLEKMSSSRLSRFLDPEKPTEKSTVEATKRFARLFFHSRHQKGCCKSEKSPGTSTFGRNRHLGICHRDVVSSSWSQSISIKSNQLTTMKSSPIPVWWWFNLIYRCI